VFRFLKAEMVYMASGLTTLVLKISLLPTRSLDSPVPTTGLYHYLLHFFGIFRHFTKEYVMMMMMITYLIWYVVRARLLLRR